MAAPVLMGAVTVTGLAGPGQLGVAAAAPAGATPVAALSVSALPAVSALPTALPTAQPAPSAATSAVRVAATRAAAVQATVYLRRGMRGPQVLAVQVRLRVRPQTGYFGRITEGAVKTFQRSKGLPATGIVDNRTWTLLGIDTPADPPPPSGYSYNLGAVRPHVKAAAYELGPKFGIRRVGGVRASSGDHGKGLALDFMTYTGTALAEYARANAGRLRVHYIIWNRRIWNIRRAGEGWRPYYGSSPHTDHVHVSFNP